MRFPKRKRANPKAGEGRSPDNTHGRHHFPQGNYEHGEHWVVCDRCGFDYHSRHIRVQWDGLAVCKGCWEPRHPQDFIRVRKERIKAPEPIRLPGPVNAAVEGSTDISSATFFHGLTTVESAAPVDQTNDPRDVVSVDASAWISNPESETIAYSAVGLPTDLSIAAATGVISGTVSTADAGVVFTPTISVEYDTSGLAYSFSFSWTITESLLPSDIDDLIAWWDFSDLETLWTTDEQDVAVASSEDAVGVAWNKTTKETDGTPKLFASIGGSGVVENDRPTWDDIERNDLGAINFPDETTLAVSDPTLNALGWDIDDENPTYDYTMVLIIRSPTTNTVNTENAVLWSSTNQRGWSLFWDDDEQSNQFGIARQDSNAEQTIVRGEPRLGTDIETEEWYMVIHDIEGTASSSTISSTTFNTVAVETPPSVLNLYDEAESHQGLSVGSSRGTNGTTIGGGTRDMYIGEVLLYTTALTSEQIDILYNYFDEKWTLSGDVE